MSPDDVDAITSDIASVYGVANSDLVVTIDYVSSGALNVSIPAGMSSSEALDSIEQSISNILGVHSSNVIVLVGEDGKITYSVALESYDDAAAMINATQDEDFVRQLDDALATFGIELGEVVSEDEVEILISFLFNLSETQSDSFISVIVVFTFISQKISCKLL